MSFKREATNRSEADSLMAETLIAISRTDSTSESDHRDTSIAPKKNVSPQVSTAPVVDTVALNATATDLEHVNAFVPNSLATISPHRQDFSFQPTRRPSNDAINAAFAQAVMQNNVPQQDIRIQQALCAIANEKANASMLQLLSNNNALSQFPSFSMVPTALNMQHQLYPSSVNLSTAGSMLTPSLSGFGQLQNCNTGPSSRPTEQTLAPSNSTTEACVRQQEIEKALHSEPQRGRKRANLNDVERLELTRSRNREHAKSTRIRKKARHEELLDYERQIQEQTEQAEVNGSRRQCLVGFVALRERMLRHAVQAASSDETNQTVQELLTLFEDASSLSLESGNSGVENINTLNAMKNFDGRLAAQVRGKPSAPGVFSYQVVGDPEDITFSAKDVALVEVMVVHQSCEAKAALLVASVLLRAQFGANSSKFQAMACTVMQMRHYEMQGDSLNAQVSYPSVVSLDFGKDRRESDEKESEMDEFSGPGMAI